MMDAPPVQYARAEDGANIAYYTLGAGPPVVHLYPHVISHLALGWRVPSHRGFIQGLAERLTVIGIDWRGCGLSDAKLVDLTLAVLIADICAVLDRLNIARASLCAWGQACPFALAFADRFPDRVSRLVIGEANLADSDFFRAVFRVGELSQPLALLTHLSLILGTEGQEDVEALAALHDAAFYTPNSGLFLHLIRTMDLSTILPNVRTPTLFVHAASDAQMPVSTAQSLIAMMPNAVLHVVPGISPMSVQRDPGALRTIVDFLLSAEPAPRPSATPAGLSAREREVLRLIAAGRSNQQIADELVISVNTVLRHVSNIFAKTGAANRAEAASYATRHGLA